MLICYHSLSLSGQNPAVSLVTALIVSLLTLPDPLTIPQVGGRPTQTTFFDLLNHSSSLVHPVRHHDVHHHDVHHQDVHDSIKLPPLK